MPNRGPRISPSIKKLIASEVIRCPGKPRAVLAVELKDIIERMGERPPGDDTLMRMISAQRNKEPKPLDKPWQLGFMREYDISPQAVPYICRVQEWAAIKKEAEVTVRQALWISRLYALRIKDIYRASEEEISHLWTVSHLYAYYEIICEISGVDFDTTELDIACWIGKAADFIVGLVLKDIANGTQFMKKANERLAGRKVKNERPHNTAK